MGGLRVVRLFELRIDCRRRALGVDVAQLGDLVRRAESGERVTITVAGRPAAVLGPVAPRAWRRWDEVASIFREPIDAEWEADRGLLDDSPTDPWERGYTAESSTPAS